MSQKITVTCPTCHHKFEVDLDAETPVQTIYRTIPAGDPQAVREYRFQCPRDGSYFIVPIPIAGED